MLLNPLESLLNRNIAGSAAARAACSRLNGKSIWIKLIGLPVSIHCRAEAERLLLTSGSDAAPDATLSGSPLGLLNLAGATPESAVRTGSVRIEGDAEVAQSFRELLKLAGPDLEEELSRLVGDVAAHQIGNAARSVIGFGRRAADTFTQNVAEYLQEEGRDLPTRVETDEFIEAVDNLRDGVERAEAKLILLERRLNAGGRS